MCPLLFSRGNDTSASGENEVFQNLLGQSPGSGAKDSGKKRHEPGRISQTDPLDCVSLKLLLFEASHSLSKVHCVLLHRSITDFSRSFRLAPSAFTKLAQMTYPTATAERVPTEMSCDGFLRSPLMLMPAMTPVRAGKNTPNTLNQL